MFFPQQQPASQALVVPGQEPLTATMLAAAPLQEQKQMLGERLFPLIQRMHPDLAGKITGMLLEIDNSELLHMLESTESLKAKVRFCLIFKSLFDPYNCCDYLGDDCIQIFHFGWYIIGYKVGKFVLRRRISGAVKHNCRPSIRRYTAPNEKFEYCYLHSYVLFNYKQRKMHCFFFFFYETRAPRATYNHDIN